jgi:3-phosphoshikimate 1-carboxyvinyltransferase
MEKAFDLEVEESPGFGGESAAPPSKSYTQRALIISAMDGDCAVLNPLRSDDTMNAARVLGSLGARIEDRGDSFFVRGFNGKPSPREGVINAGENGTLLRFTLGILSLSDGETVVEGEKSLRRRPNSAIVFALRSLGVQIEGEGDAHRVPVKIKGTGVLKGGEAVIDGTTTSQAVSSILAAAPFAEDDVTIRVEGELVSKPYVDITIDVLGWAGVSVENENYRVFRVRSGQDFRMRPEVRINGDYSSAAFLMASAAVAGSTVSVAGLAPDCQGDMKIIEILERMGAKITRSGSSVTVDGCSGLSGGEFDCSDIPDLAPVLAVLGCFAKGKTRIYNAPHLLYKESNRLAQPAGELRKLGAKIVQSEDGLVIEHSKLSSGEVSSWGDHRVAMSLAAAGIGIKGGLRIKNAECAAKSYPGFVDDMKKLNARMRAVPAI